MILLPVVQTAALSRQKKTNGNQNESETASQGMSIL